jgi:hypothetical protein
MTKRQIIDDIESAIKFRKHFQDLKFEPWSESFKASMMNESIQSLKEDLELAQRKLFQAKEEFELQNIEWE